MSQLRLIKGEVWYFFIVNHTWPFHRIQLKFYLKQRWENLQQFVTSVPKCLQSVVKRRGDMTEW